MPDPKCNGPVWDSKPRTPARQSGALLTELTRVASIECREVTLQLRDWPTKLGPLFDTTEVKPRNQSLLITRIRLSALFVHHISTSSSDRLIRSSVCFVSIGWSDTFGFAVTTLNRRRLPYIVWFS